MTASSKKKEPGWENRAKNRNLPLSELNFITWLTSALGSVIIPVSPFIDSDRYTTSAPVGSPGFSSEPDLRVLKELGDLLELTYMYQPCNKGTKYDNNNPLVAFYLGQDPYLDSIGLLCTKT